MKPRVASSPSLEHRRARQEVLASPGPDVLEAPFMRAYIAQVAESELRQFVSEDALPEDVLSQLTCE
jgi:hypothetical protein